MFALVKDSTNVFWIQGVTYSFLIICNFFRLAGEVRSSESLKGDAPELARQSTSQLSQQAEPLVEQEAPKVEDKALEAEQAPALATAPEQTPAPAPESTPQPPAATKWFPCCSCCCWGCSSLSMGFVEFLKWQKAGCSNRLKSTIYGRLSSNWVGSDQQTMLMETTVNQITCSELCRLQQ